MRIAGSAVAERVKSRAYAVQHKYREATAVYRDCVRRRKCEAADWNSLAWLSLYDPAGLTPEIGAAETAVRMTQERNTSLVHTLATAESQSGKIKEAHAGFARYVAGIGDTINDSALLLQASIAEGLGLNQTAINIYEKIAKPEVLIGDSDYEFAQIRLAWFVSRTERLPMDRPAWGRHATRGRVNPSGSSPRLI